MIGEHWLPEKRRSGEICRNLARIGPRNEYERDVAMRELLRDRIRDPVGDLYVQNSEANISVKQRHRARDTASGLSAAAEIILHQPRHGLGDDGIIFNNEDALLHPNPTRGSAHRSRATPSRYCQREQLRKFKADGLIVGAGFWHTCRAGTEQLGLVRLDSQRCAIDRALGMLEHCPFGRGSDMCR
jgi:hypothetical protein